MKKQQLLIMKTIRNLFLFTATFTFLVCTVIRANAVDLAIKPAVKKPVQRVEDLVEENEKLEERPINLKTLAEKATLNGFMELNYDYVDVSDTANENSDSTSDLYLSSVEFALRVFFNK